MGRQIAYHRFGPVTMLAPLLLGMGGCGEHTGTVDAPAPVREFSGDSDSVPSLPPGIIIAPLSLDLASALAAFEQTIPRRFGNVTQRLTMPGSPRKSYAFELTREPFTVSFARDTVVLAAIVHYQGRAWYDPPIGPDINGECGTKGDPPRARLVLRAVPRLSRNWRLQIKPQLGELAALTETERDQCKVSFLKLDMTGKVLEVARQTLTRLLPEVERKLGRLDVRTPLAKIWADLQKPIRLVDSLWLMLSPGTVHLGVMRGTSAAIGAEIGITASPRIVTGRRPMFNPTPLPPLGPVHTDQGFSMLFEGAFGYGVMSAELTSRLVGRSIKAAGGVLEVKKVTVYGVGGGRLALGFDFDGTARGRIWLLGKPSYDATTGMISVPDLDFDASSAGMLVQGLAWLKAGTIREFLRQQAKISAGAVLAQVQALAVRELNRELARGVQLSATIEKSEPAGILVRSGGLILRARATGTARLDLGRELFHRKPVDR